MVLIIILSIIIMTVFVLFELNWIVKYLIDLRLKMTHRCVTIDTMNILVVFIIENVFFVNQIESIMNDEQKTRQKFKISIDNNNNNNWTVKLNINCNTTNKDWHHVTRAHVLIFELQFAQNVNQCQIFIVWLIW